MPDQPLAHAPGVERADVRERDVEQDVRRSMAFSDHLVCLQKGTVRLAGPSQSRSLDEVRRAYFG